MEAKAYLKYARISPRKVQIVLDLIRGKDVATAMGILKNKPFIGTLVARNITSWIVSFAL